MSLDGVVTTWNAGAERIFGYSAQEVVGRSVSLLYPKDRLEEMQKLLARVRRGDGVRNYETVRVRKDGRRISVSITVSPIRNGGGTVIGASIISRDITAHKRLENQLLAKNKELEQQNRRVREASRVKNEFLANMSHELRSPLNGVIGFTELMHDGKLGPVSVEHKEYLGDILSSAKHLLQLINDMLDLAKVESGRIEFRPEPVALVKLVREVADVLRAIAAQKRIALEADVPPELNAALLDPARFKQVLYNYLSNALKFTPEDGRVTVRSGRRAPASSAWRSRTTGSASRPARSRIYSPSSVNWTPARPRNTRAADWGWRSPSGLWRHRGAGSEWTASRARAACSSRYCPGWRTARRS